LFVFSFIAYYSTASTSTAAYIIGGIFYNEKIIAEFKNNFWRQKAGQKLAKGRYAHGSITLNGETMVIGGYTRFEEGGSR